nr:tetrahydrofolylpolyglutamate synthase (EC 6.3.2.17) - pig (fragments) [Sus scrofa domesticus]
AVRILNTLQTNAIRINGQPIGPEGGPPLTLGLEGEHQRTNAAATSRPSLLGQLP